MPSRTNAKLQARTIEDFGRQWTLFDDAAGFFGSKELLADFVTPFDLSQIRGWHVLDLGAGTGRHVLALLEWGAARVVAVEPSQAIEVVREKTREFRDRVTLLQIPGHQIAPTAELDAVFSIGVIHHIPDPAPVVRAVYAALKPGGKFVVWLYGKEGNRLYLLLVTPLRWLSTHLPHWALVGLVRALDLPLALYLGVCKRLPGIPLPLADYMRSIIAPLPGDKRRLVIYDQLNPAYAKYYSRKEAEALMAVAPFQIAVHHRRGYSWVVIGEKPGRVPNGHS
jgi:SAM-dependent methyltransferase